MSKTLWLLFSLCLCLEAKGATQSDIRAQILEDFGHCTFATAMAGEPVAELKVYENAVCGGNALHICSIAVQCEGGAILPAEAAVNARLNVSCPGSGKCFADAMDCMAVAYKETSHGSEAVQGLQPLESEKLPDPSTRHVQ